MKTATSLIALAMLECLAISSAQAQTADAASTAPAEAAAPADEGIAEIVVTATKRETNLQKTPIAISVLSTTALRDRHVQSLYDLADGAVPSLRVATFEARQSALTIGIRGIVPLDANQPAREQGVGVYIDGVYLGRQHGLNAALFDVERIEVLKGPQGSLFGRNTEGGALSIVTKAPTGVFGGRATAGVSNYGGYNGELHVDFPEVANFSFKIDGVVQSQGATIRNPLPGASGFNSYDRRGGRVSFRWKPISNFTADFEFDAGYEASTPFYSQLLNLNPNGCVAGAPTAACTLPGTAPAAFTGTVRAVPAIVQVQGNSRATVADIGVPQQPSVDISHGTSLHLSWKPASSLELRSITAYRTIDSTQWDNSGGAHRPPVFNPTLVGGVLTGNAFSRYSLADLSQKQFSQELQAVGSLPRFDYVAGLYYFYEKAFDDASTPNTNTFNATGTDYTINDPRPTIPGFRSLDRASVATSRSYAAFGQFTYTPQILDDKLHLTVGGRFTHDDKSGSLYIVNNIRRPYTYAQKSSRFNPLVTLAYEAAQGINLYAKYSTGYRSGGASSRSVTYRQFGPEDVTAYEIGAKTEFFDRRVRLNVAGYIMDRTGSQVDFSTVQFDAITNSNRNTIETINAPGTTKIRGIEAELTINPIERLTLTGSYAYTYTKIPATLNPATNILQNVFIVFTPRNAASGAIDYAVPIGGSGALAKLHLDANYAQATQAFDQFATKADSSFIVNGRFSVADIDLGDSGRNVTVALWARNLFNEAHIFRRDPSNSLASLTGSVSNILGDYGNYNAPRTFGAEATIKF